MTRLAAMLRESPYQGYVYAYPHKTAYRRFPEPIPLRSVWEREDRRSLFLYVHLPFCEMRCGFCNLFTQSQPKQGLVGRYLDALEREFDQVERTRRRPVRLLGVGGAATPTFLSVAELTRKASRMARRLGVDFGQIPVGIETSPETAEPEKLALLREWNVTRVSLGVQSFREDEVRNVARPQRTAAVEGALDNLAAARFPNVNLDLIYGLPGQNETTWRQSLDRALERRPTEIFLYPLYVRPLTGLGKSGRVWDDERLALYRLGRDRLLDAGFLNRSRCAVFVGRRLGLKSDHATVARKTAWSASVAGPDPTRATSTTRGSMRWVHRGSGRSSPTTSNKPTRHFRWRPTAFASTAVNSGVAICCSRFCNRRASTWPPIADDSAPRLRRTFPNWPNSTNIGS